MKNHTTVTKFLAAATVIGALGFAYAQTNSTPTATDKGTVTGTPTPQSGSMNDSSMGTSSSNAAGSTNTGTNGNNMNNAATTGNSTSGSATDRSASGMSGERTARADRN